MADEKFTPPTDAVAEGKFTPPTDAVGSFFFTSSTTASTTSVSAEPVSQDTKPLEQVGTVEQLPKTYDRLNPKSYSNLQDGTNYFTGAMRNGKPVVKKWNAAAQEFQIQEDPKVLEVAQTKFGGGVQPTTIEQQKTIARKELTAESDKGDEIVLPETGKIVEKAGIGTYKNREVIANEAAKVYAKTKIIAQQPQVSQYMQIFELYKSTDDPTAKEEIATKLEELKSKPFDFLSTPTEGAEKINLQTAPDTPKFKTVGDAVNYTLEGMDESRLLLSDYAQTEKDLIKINEEYQQLSPQDPKGFWYNAIRAVEDHSETLNTANAIALNSDEGAMNELENSYIKSQIFPKAEPEGAGKAGEFVGGIAAAVAPTVGATMATTSLTGNPLVGMLMGGAYSAQDMARIQYANGFQEMYNEVRSKDPNLPQNLAYETAKKYAQQTAAVSGAVGMAVGMFLPALKPETAMLQKTSADIAKKFFVDVAKNSGFDFGVGATSQGLNNYIAKNLGSDRSIFDGVLESGGMMALQGLMVGTLTHGFPAVSKYVTAKNREQAINSLASSNAEQLESVFDNAIKTGSNPVEVQQLKAEVLQRLEALNQMPPNLSVEDKLRLAPLYEERQKLVTHLKDNPASESGVLPEIEKLDRKIAEEGAYPLTEREQAEYIKLRDSLKEDGKLDALERLKFDSFKKRLDAIKENKADAKESSKGGDGEDAKPEAETGAENLAEGGKEEVVAEVVDEKAFENLPFEGEQKVDDGKSKISGISHRVLQKMGLDVDASKGWNPTEANEYGKNLLRSLKEEGKNPNDILFNENDNSLKLKEKVALKQAVLAELTKEANVIGDTKGLGSDEYKQARDNQKEFIKNTSYLGGETQGAMVAHQGETDVDTGSFTALVNHYEETNGRTPNKAEQQKLQQLADENKKAIAGLENAVEQRTKELEQAVKERDEAERKLKEAEEKAAAANIKESVERDKKQKKTYTQKGKEAADFVRKFKNNPIQLVDENGNPIDITTMGVTWNDVIETVAVGLEHAGKLADLIDASLNNAKWYQNLSEKGKEAVKKQLADHFTPKEETTEGKLKIPHSLIREAVENGNDNIQDITNYVMKAIGEKYPDATERDFRDAITGYGKVINPNKEEIEVTIRKQKRIGRIISALEDIANKKRPLRSGLQRDKLDAEERNLNKELKEAMKDLPVDAETEAKQLKTSLDAIKQRLQNQIEDLNREIETGERMPVSERKVEYDEEAKALAEERDRVKAIHDEIFGNKELTDEQRINIATKALEKSIDNLEERIKTGNIFPKKSESKTPETPELKALRERREKLQEEINNLRDATKIKKTPQEIATENAIEANKKSIEEKERRIRENDLSPTPKKEVADKNNAELKALRAKNEALDKQLQKLRNDAKVKRDASIVATENAIKAIERKTKDIQDRIKNNELEKAKKLSLVNKNKPEYQKAKKKLEVEAEKLKKLQEEAGIPEKKRLAALKKLYEDKTQKNIDKLNRGDYSTAPKKPSIEVDEQTKKAYQQSKDLLSNRKLPERFIDKDKKDLSFHPKDARDIFDYLKRNYLEKNVDYTDAIGKTATDLGLTPEQVQHAIASPKTIKKSISDEIYMKQKNAREANNKAKRFVANANENPIWKGVKKANDFLRGALLFGHGTAWGTTHTSGLLLNPAYWKTFFPKWGQALKSTFAFTKQGQEAHEAMMQSVKLDPNWRVANEAGLDNDPNKQYGDYDKLSAKLPAIMNMGSRGFDLMLPLRQELFNKEWNKLSNAQKADPTMAKAIAHYFNRATGISDMKVSIKRKDSKLEDITDNINGIILAPKLEFSRWQKLAAPIKALYTFAKVVNNKVWNDKAGAWSETTAGERWAAKTSVKNAAINMATFGTALAVNSAILQLLDSKKKVNYMHPLTGGDWLDFQIGDHHVGVTGGITSVGKFVLGLAQLALTHSRKETGGKTIKDKFSTNVGNYFSGKLAPGSQMAFEIFKHHDFNGNTLPMFDDAPDNKHAKKLTWAEYFELNRTPIPVAEAFHDMQEEMKKQGMKEADINTIMQGIFVSAATGFTGARIKTSDKPILKELE